MKKDKFLQIVQAVLIIAFGVFIAISGGGAALDLYIAIVSLAAGVAFAIVAIYELSKTRVLRLSITFLSTALITVGIAILAKALSFAILIQLLVFLLIALGAALIIHSIFLFTKKEMLAGVIEILIGAVALTAGILYLTVPDFRTAFWIITGVLVAVYGVYYLVYTLVSK